MWREVVHFFFRLFLSITKAVAEATHPLQRPSLPPLQTSISTIAK